METVILVDRNDRQVGVGEKMAVHRVGLLHRAFSIFVFNSTGELLLQRRALGKYYSAGLWSNTCCGHPRPWESTDTAAHRRIREEMGFDCDLLETSTFLYRACFDNQLIEHEYDHLFVGRFEGSPDHYPCEVEEWRWVAPHCLTADIRRRPERYTFWFRNCLDRVLDSCPATA